MHFLEAALKKIQLLFGQLHILGRRTLPCTLDSCKRHSAIYIYIPLQLGLENTKASDYCPHIFELEAMRSTMECATNSDEQL